MKKLTLILLSILMIVALAACGDKKCDHAHDNACDVSCNECGEERTITHDWNDATCLTPKTCKVCGATEGEALGHDWMAADCESARSCSVCGATDGEALGHNTEEDDGNCLTPIVCPTCNAVLTAGKNEHIAHADDGDCTTAVTCKHCTTVLTEEKKHDFTGEWQIIADGHYHICKNDGCAVNNDKATHSGGEPTCSGIYCAVCKYKYDTATNPDYHEISLIDKNGKCLCGEVFEAAVDKTFYHSLDDALSNWANGTTLTLLADVVHPDMITIQGESVTLDLNGRSYSSDQTAFTINSNATLTITDTSADKSGSITSTNAEESYHVIWNYGTLNIFGGAIISNASRNATISIYGGTINMSDGVIMPLNKGTAIMLYEDEDGNLSTANISGGEIVGTIYAKGNLTISGQTKITTNKPIEWVAGKIDLGKAENAEGWKIVPIWKAPMVVGVDIILSEGMDLQVDNIAKDSLGKYVIATIRHKHIGGAATCTTQAICDICSESYGKTASHTYTDGKCACGAIAVSNLDELKSAIENGGTIVITADITLSESLTVSKNTVIELTKHTISTGNNYAFKVYDDATLTVSGDGTISGDIPIEVYNGTVNLINCTVNGYVRNNSDNCLINVRGGSVTDLAGYGKIVLHNGVVNKIHIGSGGAVTINGGSVYNVRWVSEGSLTLNGGYLVYDPLSQQPPMNYTATYDENTRTWTVTKTN